LTTEVNESESIAPAAPEAQQAAPPPAAEAARSEERSSAPAGEGGPSREERPAGPRRGGGGRGRGGGRRKVCAFCVDKIDIIDYKEPGKLRRYVSERGKIEPRRKTGTCARHQRKLTLAIKRARQIALLPYTADHNFT
jgi:small subunit ribosomal protein S18